MLSQAQRTTILELQAQGVSETRDRARAGSLPRGRAQSAALELRGRAGDEPAEKAEPYRQQILELFDRCKGNLVRVHEELVAARRGVVVCGADGVLPAARHRTRATGGGGSVSLRSRARRCSTTPPRTRWNWPAGNAGCKPPRRCCAIRGCCSSSVIRPSSVSTARCF